MMEKENFDEEFKNRIKQVFEEFDDSTASEGWNLLREKYPEKKRRDGFVWWISAAAALLLIALIFGLFQADFYQKNASKIVHQHQTDTVSALANRYSSNQKTAANKIITDKSNTKKPSIKTASGFADKHLSAKDKTAKNQVYADTLNTKKTSVKTVLSFASTQKVQPETVAENQNNTLFTGTKTDADDVINQHKFLVSASKDSSGQKMLVTAAKTTNPAFTKSAVKKYAEAEIPKKTAVKSAAFSLGLYAGTHVNYATGSHNELGLGAGVSTDFRLNKNFKLSTGLGLMQNNLTYAQNIPSGSLNAATVNYMATSANNIIIQSPSLTRMDANLVSLDLPVNLTYTFSPDKNSISVSAGISSNTFVKEAYNYQYTSTSYTQNIKSFNNFNFAKMLNISAGFAYPLGKNTLQVEPFLKYPLGGSGSQQLQFGSAGINLKINIQSFKK